MYVCSFFLLNAKNISLENKTAIINGNDKWLKYEVSMFKFPIIYQPKKFACKFQKFQHIKHKTNQILKLVKNAKFRQSRLW